MYTRCYSLSSFMKGYFWGMPLSAEFGMSNAEWNYNAVQSETAELKDQSRRFIRGSRVTWQIVEKGSIAAHFVMPAKAGIQNHFEIWILPAQERRLRSSSHFSTLCQCLRVFVVPMHSLLQLAILQIVLDIHLDRPEDDPVQCDIVILRDPDKGVDQLLVNCRLVLRR